MDTSLLVSGLIGVIIGLISGMIIQGLILRPSIGDDYEINKPKVKGKDNTLLIEQEREKDKKGFFKRIFKGKTNENKEKRKKVRIS